MDEITKWYAIMDPKGIKKFFFLFLLVHVKAQQSVYKDSFRVKIKHKNCTNGNSERILISDPKDQKRAIFWLPEKR